jgi:hypothetical protein
MAMEVTRQTTGSHHYPGAGEQSTEFHGLWSPSRFPSKDGIKVLLILKTNLFSAE